MLVQSAVFLNEMARAQSKRAPADRVLHVVDKFIDVPTDQLPSLTGLSPEEAHKAVELLRQEGKLTVVRTAEGGFTLRRAVAG